MSLSPANVLDGPPAWTGLSSGSSASLSPGSSVDACGQGRGTSATLDPTSSELPCSGQSAYVSAVLLDSPLAFWELQDASGNPVDSSGNGLDFTSVLGSPTYEAAGPISDFAIEFAGGQGTSRATISTVTDNFSIELFIYPVSVTNTSQTIFYNGNGASNGFGLLTNYAASNFRLVAICGGVGFLAQFNTTLSVNTWYHVVVVRESTVWTYYVNGAVDLANAGTTSPNTPSGGTTKINTDSSVHFSAAYVAYYETPLSAAEVAAHYAASGL